VCVQLARTLSPGTHLTSVPRHGAESRLKVFVAYRDAPERRAALTAPRGAPERYRLFGLDELASLGAEVEHNLGTRVPAPALFAGRALNRIVYGSGGYGGDFASILGSLRQINAADVVLSTVDTVGIPLVLLKRFGVVRTPIVYVAIGLPERLVQLRRLHGLYRRALRGTHVIVSYAESEARWLRDWLGRDAHVAFIPFGVDTNVFHPLEREPEFDVVSIGADPRRDFRLLANVAAAHPELSVRIVASADHTRRLGDLPTNVSVEADIPLAVVRDRLAAARVVALPVRGNSYSGATTTLLQAMAMAKPIVVSRTDAIATGYGLEDGANCRLVSPGDADAFEQALLKMLADADAATALGIRARETVERSLSWERYTNALWELLSP
jgi:glycosyltransferase involved in cell wall biosynthesis